MVAWVVINRQRTRQSPPSFFPRSHSHFGSHASLISEKTTPFVSYTYLEPILHPFSFHALAHSFALFCTHQKLNSFVFNRFRTLCAKHPGWGRGSVAD